MSERTLSVPLTLGAYVLMAAAAWLWLPGIRPWRSTEIARDAAVGAGVGLAIVAATQLARRSRWAGDMEEEFRKVLGRPPAAALPVLALASGGAEEFFFRGALQSSVGVWLQALLFGALHVPFNSRMAPWPLFAGVVGLLFGWLTIWTGNLWAAILAHATINQLNLSFILHRGGADR